MATARQAANPGGMEQSYLIIVGVDGSDASHRALHWAAHEASARGGTVQAVTAWRWDLPSGGLPPAGTGTDPREQAEQILAQELATLPAGVPLTSQVREGRPAEVLGSAARDADLLVLGSHGHSRIWHAVLGSVAEECVRQANCPVVVVPPAEQIPQRAKELSVRQTG